MCDGGKASVGFLVRIPKTKTTFDELGVNDVATDFVKNLAISIQKDYMAAIKHFHLAMSLGR